MVPSQHHTDASHCHLTAVGNLKPLSLSYSKTFVIHLYIRALQGLCENRISKVQTYRSVRLQVQRAHADLEHKGSSSVVQWQL